MTYPLIKLIDDNITEIRYVYHISDIHIRNLDRHDEYELVFNRTFQKIISECKNKENKSIIIITGDIMHTKTILSPDANDMAYHFFRNLSQILPVIVIAGNHDCLTSNIDRLDALTPIINNGIGLDKVFYLKRTGFYQYHNIIFGLTDVYADSPLLSEYITSNMYKKVKQKNKYNIALYHGPVSGSKTDLGYEIKSEIFRGKDFRKYDYGFLGDIHKHQYLNDAKTIAYSGSLIQQSHGESLDKHGILKWDLQTGDSDLIEIPNDYGYCKINVLNGKMIDEIVPKKPRIRFILENTTQHQFQELEKEIKEKYGKCEITKENKIMPLSKLSNKTKKLLLAGNDHNEFVKKYFDKYSPHGVNPIVVYDRHKKIYNKITKDHELDGNIGGQYWKIHKLKFSNVFSYGKNNIVNFDNYKKNQIIGIVAPNHYGKSAILDIILYCLFVKSSRGNAADIMNRNENKMECSLLFSITGQKYLIERTATRSKNNARITSSVNFMKIDDDKKKSLNGASITETNKNIIKLIGNYDDYLTSYICTQEKDGNFINKTNLKKKEYLYEILKLNVFDKCFNYANIKQKSYKIELETLEKEKNRIPIDNIKNETDKLKEKITNLKLEKNKTQKLFNIIDITLKTIKIPVLVKYYGLSIYQLDTMDDITNTINNLTKKFNETDFDQISNKISIYQQSLDDLKKENSFDELITKIADIDNLLVLANKLILKEQFSEHVNKTIEELKLYNSIKNIKAISLQEEWVKKLSRTNSPMRSTRCRLVHLIGNLADDDRPRGRRAAPSNSTLPRMTMPPRPR